MIVVINYKMGNIGSILNMLKKVGARAIVSSDPKEIKNAEKLILPGVGAFDTGMKNLSEAGLIPVLEQKVLKEKTPILGICLGMQLFAEKSEEGSSRGLGWIEGKVKKFQNGLIIPHMGWNTINSNKNDPLLEDMLRESRFYFVHSYHFICDNQENELAKTSYGYDFSSIIRKDNIIGVQFHPEKSHKYGMKLLDNFVNKC